MLQASLALMQGTTATSSDPGGATASSGPGGAAASSVAGGAAASSGAGGAYAAPTRRAIELATSEHAGFLSSAGRAGFRGQLKSRHEDFVVTEIDLDGSAAELTRFNEPDPADVDLLAAPPNPSGDENAVESGDAQEELDDSLAALAMLISADELRELSSLGEAAREGSASSDDLVKIRLPVGHTKATRTHLHRCIRQVHLHASGGTF